MHGAVNCDEGDCVVESGHVLAQSNVWEMRSEKQMAAWRMKRGREGGGTTDDEPTYNIHHFRCLYVHPLYFTPHSQTGNETGRRQEEGYIMIVSKLFAN